MFSAELMMAPMMRRPSVVGPTSTSSTRGEAAATVSKYLVIDGPVGEPAVGAHLEPEERLGRRHLRRSTERREQKETKNERDIED